VRLSFSRLQYQGLINSLMMDSDVVDIVITGKRNRHDKMSYKPATWDEFDRRFILIRTTAKKRRSYML